MTTTVAVTRDEAFRLLAETNFHNNLRGIGTPDSHRRNYALDEALACARACSAFTLQDTNGIQILTGANWRTGDHHWYINTVPSRDPWA